MTTKEIESIVKELLTNQKNITKQLSVFQNLNNLLTNSESFEFEKNLRKLLLSRLESKNPDLQICALCVLCTCLSKGYFKKETDLDIAHLVIEIACSTMTSDVENQELWLKAYSALELMDDLYMDLYKTHSLELIKIVENVLNSGASSLQKMSVLRMFNDLVMNTNRDVIETNLMSVWIEQICPLIFNINNSNLQNVAMEVSYNLLPHLQKMLINNTEYFKTLRADIEKRYLSVMKTLVAKENCLYAKLWIFLTKLLTILFRKGAPGLNMLLTVIESAFSTHQQHDVRMHAFYCWQELIESFASYTYTNKDSEKKRINLLIIPLKAKNCKTEKLIEVKFLTWCKLFNVLKSRKFDFSSGILDQFLNFCFGPLCQQPLITYSSHVAGLTCHAKKFPSVHLQCCKAFLQLLGRREYIDEELNAKLKFFGFERALITQAEFKKFSKLIVDSVGECSIMLSQLENSDRFECVAINEALWKSLFHLVDSVDDEDCKNKATEEISELILALAGVARRKSSLVTFSLVPLFNIITSGEFKFFKNEKMSQLLFIPMVQAVVKKDKALLQHDIISLFNKIFIYKRDEDNFLNFIQTVLEKFSLVLKDNIELKKLTTLHNIWFILGAELRYLLETSANFNTDDDFHVTVFSQFFTWPVASLHNNFDHSTLLSTWKEMYELYGKHTSDLSQNKLAAILMKNFLPIMVRDPQLSKIAEIINFIIKNLKYSCTKDTCGDINNVYVSLKEFISLKTLENESIQIFENTLTNIFGNINKLAFLHCILQPVIDCAESILHIHNRSEILEQVAEFIKTLKYDKKLKLILDRLINVVPNVATDMKKANLIVDSYESYCSNRKSTKSLRVREGNPSYSMEVKRVSPLKIKIGLKSDAVVVQNNLPGPSNLPTPEVDKLNDDSQKQQTTKLLGYDIETMAPVKLRSSVLKRAEGVSSINPANKSKIDEDQQTFVVHTPYKFNPRMLTKSQKKKLSKRHDDIPALYQDLSQSQTLDFCSNSESLSEPKTEENKTKDMNVPSEAESKMDLTAENPFSILIQNNDKTENKLKVIKGHRTRRKNLGIIKSDDIVSSKETPNKFVEQDTKQSDNCKENEFALEKDEKTEKETKNENMRTSKRKISSKEDSNKSKSEKIDEETPLLEKSSKKLKQRRYFINDIQNKIPAKITRGMRRKSTGSIKKSLSKEISTSSLSDLENRQCRHKHEKITAEGTPGVKIRHVRVSRELQRLKLDIKNSEYYMKNDKRRTRMSVAMGENVDEIKSISLQTELVENFQESEPIIENSQEIEIPINLKQCKIPVLYPLEEIKPGEQIVINTGDSEVDVVKGPKTTSPFTIVEKYSLKNAENSIVPKKLTFSTDREKSSQNFEKQHKNPVIVTIERIENEDQTFSETQSVSSEVLKELNVEKQNISIEIIDNSKRKVLFCSTQDDEALLTPEQNSPLEQLSPNNITSSPVSNETPNRNKELVKNTLDISPIRKRPEDEENILLVVQKESTERESPDIFNSEPSCSYTHTETERNGIDSPHPHIFSRKKLSKNIGGRNAHMMELISVRSNLYSNSKNKKQVRKCAAPFISPAQNRIMKIMEHLEKCDSQEIAAEVVENNNVDMKNEDIFTFSKALPSPFASPSGSSLKKRKFSHDPDDAALQILKRRRVHFSDPPVSCTKFIEKNTKNKFRVDLNQDFIPQEPRVTRSSGGILSDTELNLDLQETANILEELTDNSKTDFSNLPDNTNTPKSEPDILDSNLIENSSENTESHDNKLPTCETSINCTDLVDSLNPSIQFKSENNKTEDQIRENNFEIDSTIDSQVCTPVRPTRKIKPITLYSPENKITNCIKKSCEVSVITENKSQPISDTSVLNLKPNSESLFSESVVGVEPISESTASLPNAQDVLRDELSTLSIYETEPLLERKPELKNSILEEEIFGEKIENILSSIVGILHDKKYDLQPLLKLLSQIIPNLRTVLFNMDDGINNINTFEEWKQCFKNIIQHNGIEKTVKYLGKIEDIDQSLLVDLFLKYNITDEIKKDKCTDIIKQFDCQTICQSICKLANNAPEYKECLKTEYLKIIDNSEHFHDILPKLQIVEIGDVVINRMNPQETNEFLEKLFNATGSDQYLKPVPKELLVTEVESPLVPEDILEESGIYAASAASLLQRISEGNVSKKLVNFILQRLLNNVDPYELVKLFHNEIDKKLDSILK